MFSAVFTRITQNLRTKIFAVFVIFIFVSSFSFTIFFINRESRSYHNRLLAEGTLLCTLLSHNARLAVFADNKRMMLGALDGIIENPKVLAAGLYAPSGAVLTYRDKGGREIYGPVTVPVQPAAPDFDKPVSIEGNGYVLFIAPIAMEYESGSDESIFFPEATAIRNGQIMAYARVVVDSSEISVRRNHLIFVGSVFCFLFLVVGSSIYYLMLKGLTRPLQRLTEKVVHFGQGDFTERVPVDSADEIGHVASAFNEMAESLQRRDCEIRSLHEELTRIQKQEAKEEWERTFDTVPDLVAIIDRDFCVERMNRTMASRLGTDKESVIGVFLEDLLPSFASVQPLSDMGDGHAMEVCDERLGGYFWVTLTPLVRQSGEVSGAVYVGHDITRRKEAEEEQRAVQAKLIQTNKMASLGFIFSGLAHDVNNPNSAIYLAGHLLEKSWKDIKPVLDNFYTNEGDFRLGGVWFSENRDQFGGNIKAVIDNSRRIEGIINNLKDYVRKGKASITGAVDINTVVSVSISLLTNHIKRLTDHLVVDLADDLPKIRGNSQQLEQVVINLVLNALQALPDRRCSVSIATFLDRTADEVVIMVKDEGSGMSKEMKEHLFEPFVSTKIDRGGTGLGLAISNFIIGEHLGKIEIESEEGHGTTAKVRLPRSSDAINADIQGAQ